MRWAVSRAPRRSFPRSTYSSSRSMRATKLWDWPSTRARWRGRISRNTSRAATVY